jgi:hypothetical protein
MTETTLIYAKTLSFFGRLAGSQIDFTGFDPMLPFNAASDRSTIRQVCRPSASVRAPELF